MSGSRQFTAEGEPVTRHVFSTIINSDKPVYGLFITNKLDPNTANAFHKAQYWRNWRTEPVPTPVVALETKQVIALVQCVKSQSVGLADIKQLLIDILSLQDAYQDGPSWYNAYSELYETWRESLDKGHQQDLSVNMTSR
jgi:AlwI restriction endonuclease